MRLKAKNMRAILLKYIFMFRIKLCVCVRARTSMALVYVHLYVHNYEYLSFETVNQWRRRWLLVISNWITGVIRVRIFFSQSAGDGIRCTCFAWLI